MKSFLLVVMFAAGVFAAGGDTLNFTTAVKTLADGDTFYSGTHWGSLRDTVARVVNGRLGNVNIAANANIAVSKLDTTGNLKSRNAKLDTLIVDSLTLRAIKITGSTSNLTLDSLYAGKINGGATVQAQNIIGSSTATLATTVINSLQIPSDDYGTIVMFDEGSFTCSLYVQSGRAVVGTASYQILNNVVTLFLPELKDTSTWGYLNMQNIPAAIRPATAKYVNGVTCYNGSASVTVDGGIYIFTTGAANLLHKTFSTPNINIAYDNWLTSGTKGIAAQSITYDLY